MKLLRLLLLPLLVVPALAQKVVRVTNATSVLADPSDFWTANATAIGAAFGNNTIATSALTGSILTLTGSDPVLRLNNTTTGLATLHGGAHDGDIDVYLPDNGGTILATNGDGSALTGLAWAHLTGVPSVNGHSLASGNVTVTPADLSLVIGTNVQAHSTLLDNLSGLGLTSGNLIVSAGGSNLATAATTTYGLSLVNAGNSTAALSLLGGAASADLTAETTRATGAEAQISASRSPQQAFNFDGSGYATIINGPAPGTRDFSFFAWINLASAPTDLDAIIGGDLSASFNFGVHPDLSIVTGVAGAIDYPESTAGVVPLGQWVLVGYTLNTATHTGTYYAAGKAVGTITDTYAYIDSCYMLGARNGGYNYFKGAIARPLWINRCLSATEVAQLSATGQLPAVDTLVIGSNTQNTSLTADTGSPTVTSATAVTFTSGSSQRVHTPTFNYTHGGVVKVTGTASGITSGYINIYLAGSANVLTVSGNGNFSGTITTGSSGPNNVYVDNAGYAATLTNLNVQLVGALLSPDPRWDGNGSYWPDTSGNGAHIQLASGVTPALRKTAGELVAGLHAPGAVMITINVSAGQSFSSGDTLGSINFPAGGQWGEWLLASSTGGIYYIGGNFADGGSNTGQTMTEIGRGGRTNSSYGLYPVALTMSVVDASNSQLSVVATSGFTASASSTISVILLSGSVPPALVK